MDKTTKQTVNFLVADGCACRIDGEWFVMTSTRTGEHRLAVSVTDHTRLMAHWEGFVSNHRAQVKYVSAMPDMLAIQYPDGTFAGSPCTVRTRNINMCGTYRDQSEADRIAASLGDGARVVKIGYATGRGAFVLAD